MNRPEPRCIYLTHCNDCRLHSDGVDFIEPCLMGPCEDAEYERKPIPIIPRIDHKSEYEKYRALGTPDELADALKELEQYRHWIDIEENIEMLLREYAYSNDPMTNDAKELKHLLLKVVGRINSETEAQAALKGAESWS